MSAVFALGDLLPASTNSPVVELQGRGVQIYICEQGSGAMAWHLKGPEAAPLNAAGSEVRRPLRWPELASEAQWLVNL